MPTIEEALARLSEKAKEISPITGLHLIGIIVGYMTWDESYPYRSSLTKLLKDHNLFVEEEEEDFRKLETTYIVPDTKEEIPIRLHSILTSDGLLLSITDTPAHYIERIHESLVREPRMFYMWLPPFLIEDFATQLTNEYPQAKVDYFVARRIGRYDEPAVLRPHVKRTLTYYGSDGEQTFHELAIPYGLSLDTIGISIEGVARLRAKTTGVFSILHSASEAFLQKFFSSYALQLIMKAMEIKAATQNAKNELGKIQTANKQLNIPVLIPLIIKFSKEFRYEDATTLLQSIDEMRFSMYNTVVRKGSILIDSMILDESKNSLFAINVSSDRITIAPHSPDCFDSLIRFYQLIVETLDSKATCVYSTSLS